MTVSNKHVSRSGFLRLAHYLKHLSTRGQYVATWIAIFGAAAVMLLFIILPGRTFVAAYIQDVMAFWDGADRILKGQVPNEDFHSPLGPLTFYFPAAGLWIGRTAGTMFPLATALFAACALPLVAHAAGSRLPLGYAVGIGLLAALILIAPLNPGEFATGPSFAMYYNRWGWVLLSGLFLFILPRRAGSASADGLVIAAILLALFYLKVSFAAFGLVFVLGLLILRETRSVALLGLGWTVLGVALVEFAWGQTGRYLIDLSAAAGAGGVVRGAIFGLGRAAIENSTALLIYISLLLIGWLRGVSYLVLAATMAMALAGIFLINQNYQVTGIVTLLPAGLVALLARAERPRAECPPSFTLIGATLLLALSGHLAVNSFLALVISAAEAARGPNSDPFEARLDGLITREGQEITLEPGAQALVAAYQNGQADLATINFIRHASYRQPLGQSEYVKTIAEAAQLLRSDPQLAGPVFVLDFANPLNAITGRSPPRGAEAWYAAGRNLTEQRHPVASTTFAEAAVIMDPKAPVELYTHQLLHKIYWSYLDARYELVAETTYWRAYRRRSSVTGAAR